MATIALKIDVDTYRGTREGVPRLAQVLKRVGAQATFLFSVGPDHTGRAIKRVFRPGFMGKVKRTSVVEHYGLKTLMYGVLLPGPHIGKRCRSFMHEIARSGFEVGVHTYDHIKWQDGVATASESWTRRELTLALDEFVAVFGQRPVGAWGRRLAGERLRAGSRAGAGVSLCFGYARRVSVVPVVAGTEVAGASTCRRLCRPWMS